MTEQQKYEGQLVTRLRTEYQVEDVFKKTINGQIKHYALFQLEFRADGNLWFKFFISPDNAWLQIPHPLFCSEVNNGTFKKVDDIKRYEKK